jgi:molybdopterin-biosynthesis enzyme MoeA-like protein
MTVLYLPPPSPSSSHVPYPLDITYASLAKSFSQPLVHHPETLSRMRRAFQHRRWLQDVEISDEQREATDRMALFPENAEVLFVATEMWVVSHRLPPPPVGPDG